MPSKNSIKQYIENGHYHIYNRGIEKRRIFEEAEDYKKFLHYLKYYLSPVDSLLREDPLARANIIKGNLSEQVDLLAYCLMPNHFHMLVKQKTKDGITKLMRQVTTAYSVYFNKKYQRVGHLFQGRFKAVLVETDEYLLHLSRYIHQNPKERGVSLSDFAWSSYSSYIGRNEYEWLKPQEILAYFSTVNNSNNYRDFMDDNSTSPPQLQNLILE